MDEAGEYFGCSSELKDSADGSGSDHRSCEVHKTHHGGSLPSWGHSDLLAAPWKGWTYCMAPPNVVGSATVTKYSFGEYLSPVTDECPDL